MKWIKGKHPKKGMPIGIIGSKRYLLRMQSGKNAPQYTIKKWIGDRWNGIYYNENSITHYMLIEEPNEMR